MSHMIVLTLNYIMFALRHIILNVDLYTTNSALIDYAILIPRGN